MMNFEQTVLHCGAPALCGIKPACLLSVNKKTLFNQYSKILQWNLELKNQDTFIKIARRNKELYLIFIYDKNLLARTIFSIPSQKYLLQKGYRIYEGFDSVLTELLSRLSNSKSFPHEIGLFLGYPIEDVIGYERNFGCNCKFCGAWAVYGDVESAKSKMKLFKDCSKNCCKLLDKGEEIPSISKKWRNENEKSCCLCKYNW